MNELTEFFKKREQHLVDRIRELVDIESPSCDESGSRDAVDYVEKIARQNELITGVEREYRKGFGEHLVMRAFSDIAAPQILLLGHLDTVHPRGASEKNPTRIEGDRLYGCGVFDMKANCILMLEILNAYRELGLKPKRPISVLLSCDEEVGSDTGRELVEREASVSAACLVCEPSAQGRAKTERKGTGWYEIKAHGIPSHAGLEPEKGASAILELSKQIQFIHSLNKLEVGTTVNVCTIKGGTTSNVIPEHAAAEVDVRFTSMSEAERIDAELRKLSSFDERVSLHLSGGINRPPLERTPGVAALFEQAKAIGKTLDYELGETQVGGASDGNFVGALGIPVLDGLGISGNGAHTNHEYILIPDITGRAALLASLILSL